MPQKHVFSLSRVKTAAPGAPHDVRVRCAARQRHICPALSPAAIPPGSADCDFSSSVGGLPDSSGETASAQPAFFRTARNIQRGDVETFFSNSEGISRRGTSQNPAPRVPSCHRNIRAVKEPAMRRPLLPCFPVAERKKGCVKHAAFSILTLQPQARRLLPPFPQPRRDEWEP